MPQYQDPAAADALRYLRGRVESLEKQIDFLRSSQGSTFLVRGDHENFPTPAEGQVMVNYLTDKPYHYARGAWHPLGGGNGIYDVKVFEDINVVVAGDGADYIAIPEDLDGAVLLKCEAFVSTASSSGTVQVQLHKLSAGVDMLSTKLSIDVGELHSKTAASQPVVNPANDDVAWGDYIRIDVDNAGTGAKGLEVKMYFQPAATAAVAIQGAKGDPGGVTSWTGAWSGATTYVANEAVSHNGTSYVARTGSTAVEPGVTAGWQTYWMVLAGAQQISSIEVILNGNGYVLSPGVKAHVEAHFPFTIQAVEMFADAVGSMVVDIWKDTYANYPPADPDSITSSSPPTLSGASKSTDTVLSGWTTSVAAGDVLAFNIDSVSLISRVTIALKIART